MTIALLMTGDELLMGDILDTNSRMIADHIAEMGLELKVIMTVGDDLEAISTAINYLAAKHSVVVINGGLGPTMDDLTAQAIAHARRLDLEYNTQAVAGIQAWCDKKKTTVSQQQLKQARLPSSAEVLNNPIGSAPGFYLNDTQQKTLIIATPGVPSELEMILKKDIVPLLRDRFVSSLRKYVQRLRFFGLGESRLQSFVDTHVEYFPEAIKVGFRVDFPMVEFKLMSDSDHVHLVQLAKERLMREFSDHLIAENFHSMAAELIHLLQKKQQTLAVAESCTGGLVAHLVCREPGASSVFPGAAVTYSNLAKQDLIGVQAGLLAENGAVSEPVALSMLTGVIQQFSSNYGIAITGIAGPSGGSANKPVGTVYIAWGSTTNQHVEKFCFQYDREHIQIMAAFTAINRLKCFVYKSIGSPIESQ